MFVLISFSKYLFELFIWVNKITLKNPAQLKYKIENRKNSIIKLLIKKLLKLTDQCTRIWIWQMEHVQMWYWYCGDIYSNKRHTQLSYMKWVWFTHPSHANIP